MQTKVIGCPSWKDKLNLEKKKKKLSKLALKTPSLCECYLRKLSKKKTCQVFQNVGEGE